MDNNVNTNTEEPTVTTFCGLDDKTSFDITTEIVDAVMEIVKKYDLSYVQTVGSMGNAVAVLSNYTFHLVQDRKQNGPETTTE